MGDAGHHGAKGGHLGGVNNLVLSITKVDIFYFDLLEIGYEFIIGFC